jgi:hypothetical protein
VHAVIPAVREADRVAATAAALVAAALAAAAVVMLAALAAVVAMRAVAASAAVDMAAAADIGKQLRLSSKRLVCFGRRAFFVELNCSASEEP